MTKGEAAKIRACMICGSAGAELLRLADGRNVRACLECLRNTDAQDWVAGKAREPIGDEAQYAITAHYTDRNRSGMSPLEAHR